MDRTERLTLGTRALAGEREAMDALRGAMRSGDGTVAPDLDEIEIVHNTMFFAGDTITTLSIAAHLGRDPMAMAGELLNLYEHFGYQIAPQNRRPPDWLPYLLSLWIELHTLAPDNENCREITERYLWPCIDKLLLSPPMTRQNPGEQFWRQLLEEIRETVS